MTCLSDNEVADFVSGRMKPEARAAATEHMAGCSRCRISVAETFRYLRRPGQVGEAANDSDAPPDKDKRERISRYAVTREVGAGAIGVVYEAFDPQLKRAVAIKLLREEKADATAREKG